MNEKIVFDFLNANSIAYKLFRHQPVFTVEDKPMLIDSDVTTIPGLQSKSLFLKDKKCGSFFLVSVSEEKRVDLKALGDALGGKRFSFGKEEELLEHLKVQPGSVTPFGLIFDEHKKVTFVLDEDFLTTSFVNFHPLRNDMTISLTPQDFLICSEKMGHQPLIIRIPVREG
jgi:Ala-tRNA(Pro) deacylase